MACNGNQIRTTPHFIHRALHIASHGVGCHLITNEILRDLQSDCMAIGGDKFVLHLFMSSPRTALYVTTLGNAN